MHTADRSAKLLARVLLLLPAVFTAVHHHPVVAAADAEEEASLLTRQLLVDVRYEITQLKRRGCYVEESTPDVDIQWGMLGRLGVFDARLNVVKQQKNKLYTSENKMKRLVESLQHHVTQANCYCDTHQPCQHNASCTNLEPQNSYHYFSAGKWTNIVGAASTMAMTSMRLYSCDCPAGTREPDCESILPCCSFVRNETTMNFTRYTCITGDTPPQVVDGDWDANSKDSCELTGNRFSTYKQANQAESNAVHRCSNGGLVSSKNACERTGYTFVSSATVTTNYWRTFNWTKIQYWAECNEVC